MKKSLLIFTIIASIAACKKTPVLPTPPVLTGTNVYVAGYENKVARYWKNETAVILSNPTVNTAVFSIVVVGKDVYTGGYEINGVGKVALYWKNGIRTPLTAEINTTIDCQINAMAVSGSDVYAAGFEGKIARYWKNGVAVSLTGTSANGRNAGINGIVVIGNDVYAAGFENILRTVNGYTSVRLVAKYWKNGVDVELKGTEDLTTSNAFSIAVAGGDVYVVGYTNGGVNGGNYKKAKLWKNGIDVDITDGLKYNAVAHSIAVTGSDVYVAGIEDSHVSIASVMVAKYWKNGVTVNLTDSTKDAEAASIAVSGSDVFVAGYELDNRNMEIAKYWKNGKAVILTDGTKFSRATAIAIGN